MKKLLPILFTLCACCGCGQRTNYRPLAVEQAVPLEGVVLEDTILTSLATNLQIVGDYLAMIYLDTCENQGHLYTKDGERLVDFCSIGKGPGEAIAANAIVPDRDSVTLWIYDAQVKKMIRWRLDSLLAGNRTPMEEWVLDVPFFADEIFAATNGMTGLLGAYILPTKHADRFALMTREGEVTHMYDRFPEATDTIVMKSAWRNSSAALSPDGKRLAAGLYFGAILELFDVEDDTIRQRYIEYFVEPEFPYDKWGNPTDYEVITFGFGPLCASNEHVYATYNGTKDFRKMNYLVVFDWNGALEAVYKTDLQFVRTAYDEKMNAIFAIGLSPEGECRLMRFDLPTHRPAAALGASDTAADGAE